MMVIHSRTQSGRRRPDFPRHRVPAHPQLTSQSGQPGCWLSACRRIKLSLQVLLSIPDTDDEKKGGGGLGVGSQASSHLLSSLCEHLLPQRRRFFFFPTPFSSKLYDQRDNKVQTLLRPLSLKLNYCKNKN